METILASGPDHGVLLHPEAVAHLPPFITLPGQTDWFLIGVGIFLIAAVVGVGVFYLKLHALPEQMAHSGQKMQFEIVAVLALIALFTHNHAFWIAGLLLAMIPIPDFTTPLSSMAESLGLMARRKARPVPPPPEPDPVPASTIES
ncbi:hypothetical protein RM190_12335 [Paracoccus sp. CPCC 101403]|uniref:Uncharacterized protein n=1 Tax=Paracoccus broussonetiae TaxID=3075834 RepID=A0ABU3EEJ8_9RHOB|nr:hypothetical protein [Paracoccus sp. CPCC 101403]MDT1062658.1 hypothetical protein [Paracoccus sp. CPCC 101403]